MRMKSGPRPRPLTALPAPFSPQRAAPPGPAHRPPRPLSRGLHPPGPDPSLLQPPGVPPLPSRPRGQAGTFRRPLEFLVIGHALGRKTLLRGVDLLPPGTGLACENGAVRPFSYLRGALRWAPEDAGLAREGGGPPAGNTWRKSGDRYKELCDDPVLGFLSGGWDSRLLVALFAEAGAYRTDPSPPSRGCAWVSTTSPRKPWPVRWPGLLGVENRFVPPSYRDPSTLHARAARLDHATWFHDWAFRMAGEVPLGRYLMLDGLLGDILLRALLV